MDHHAISNSSGSGSSGSSWSTPLTDGVVVVEEEPLRAILVVWLVRLEEVGGKRGGEGGGKETSNRPGSHQKTVRRRSSPFTTPSYH